ncbi:hypothetical protein Tco_0795573, partial [Tanacetum coccineum]
IFPRRSPPPLPPSPPPSPPLTAMVDFTSKQNNSNSCDKRSWEISRLNYAPDMLVRLLGLSSVDVAYADAPEAKAEAKSPLPPEAHATHVDMEAIAKKEQTRLEGLLKSKGMPYCDHFSSTRSLVVVFFLELLFDVTFRVKVEERATCLDIVLRAWDSGVAWQLTLNHPVVKREVVEDKGSSDSNDGDFCVLLFHSLMTH